MWNCQGLRSALTVSYFSDLSRRNKPYIIFLMETKNKEDHCERIKRKLKMERNCYVEPNGLSRGLALWWWKDIDVVIHRKEEAMVDTTVNLSNGGWGNLYNLGI